MKSLPNVLGTPIRAYSALLQWQFNYTQRLAVQADQAIGTSVTPTDLVIRGVNVGEWLPYFNF
jgi:hypothetical protein